MIDQSGPMSSQTMSRNQIDDQLSRLGGPSVINQIIILLVRYLIRTKRYYIASALRSLVVPLFILGTPLYYIATSKSNFHITPNKDHVYAFVLVLFWPILHNINIIVNDKATHFKSLMFMMGLKRKSYMTASFLNYLLCTIHIMLLLMYILIGYSYKSTPIMVTVAIFTLFLLQLASFSYLFASLLPSTKFTLILIPILILEYFFAVGICNWANYLGNTTLARFLIFMGGISPFQGLRNFADSYRMDGSEQEFHIEQNYSDIIIRETNTVIASTQTFWTVLLFVLSIWFEEICPWKTDTEIKRPFFFLKKSPAISNESTTYAEDKCMIGSRYFERCPQNRPTGLRMMNLKKSYKSKSAVDGVNMRIFRGETTLLLGHNGAGKTTLMNMLLGQSSLDEGSVERPNNCGLGVCPQSSIVDESQTVYEHLKLFASIKASNWDSEHQERHIKAILREVGLEMHSHKLPGQLSGGMLRKLSLGMALVGGSNILILDEPSSGLDPDSRVFIWNAIRRSRSNKTVLLSSQHMEEADYLGDRIAIMSEGQIVCCGSALFLKELFGSGYKLRIECPVSEQYSAVDMIKKFFPAACIADDDNQGDPICYNNISNNDTIEQGDDREKIISLNVALTPNKREIEPTKQSDDELRLINMLEYIETNKTPIKSHGLKSSSIEDVLLNTNRYFKETDTTLASFGPMASRQKGRVVMEIDTTERLIDFMLKAPRDSVSSKQEYLSSQWRLLKALLIKNVLQYKSDWLSVIFFRIILPCLAIYIGCREVDSGYPNLQRRYGFMSMKTRLLFGIPIIAFVHYPIVERCSKFKSMIQTSDANYMVYWFSHLICDILSSSLVLIIAINICLPLVVELKISESTSRFVIHLILSSALLMYTISGALLAYNISLLFKSANLAIAKVVIPININMGFMIWCMIMVVFEMIAYPSSINQGLDDLFWVKVLRGSDKFFVSVMPQDSFAYIAYGLRLEGYYIKDNDQFPQVSSPVNHGFIALIGQMIILIISLFTIEHFNIDLRSYTMCSRYIPRFRSTSRKSENQQLDHDVIEESISALKYLNTTPEAKQPTSVSTLASEVYANNTDSLITDGRRKEIRALVAGDLCKSYMPNVPVINHLSFTVKLGECFGLLGVNGSGKSTTFSMLVADIKPDTGKILLNNYASNANLNKYRSQIAYDPQSNPEISLTCKQTLTLMARLRLINESVIPKIVDAIMQVLDISEHSQKLVKNLSGGTKRKLALAMSLIGNPGFLALDEPTAGVDPIARRKIWLLLKTLRTKNNVSIIVSSHAMEECEAICDRISIMARGRLRCLGSFLHLQSKYAVGCNVKITFSGQDPEENEMNDIIDDLRKRLELAFRSTVKLDDSNENSAIFSIECDLQRSKLLKIMRNFSDKYKQIHYIINDTSLEDVFKKIANENANV